MIVHEHRFKLDVQAFWLEYTEAMLKQYHTIKLSTAVVHE